MRSLALFACGLLVACGGSSADFSEEPDATPADTAVAAGDSVGADAETSPPADAACSAPRTVCGAACVDTKTDPNHCGACGNACTELGLSCVSGACKCTGAMCGGRCTNPKTDPNHCGTCGDQVCENEVCVDGKPQCAPGFAPCGGSPGCLGCAALVTDGANCGACGTSCGGGTCLKGKCVDGAMCPAPLTRCSSFIFSGGCTDLGRDPSNCGACDKQCKPDELCAKGKCTPYAGAVGCSTCPCANCKGSLPQCCTYGKTPICTTACP